MSDERTHFRCHAWGLLSVAICQANRRLPLALRRSSSNKPSGGKVRPLSCRDCPKAAGVDAGTEPSLSTLAQIERDLRPILPFKNSGTPPQERAAEPPGKEISMKEKAWPGGLVLTRKAGQVVTIGEHILVTVLEVKGRLVRLHFHAPASYAIHRQEEFERIAAKQKHGLQPRLHPMPPEPIQAPTRGESSPCGPTMLRESERPVAGEATGPEEGIDPGDMERLTRFLNRRRN